MSQEELRALYRGALVLLYPSINEGFGFPVLEVASQGCPSIVSNAGSLPEIALNKDLICDPYSLPNIIQKLDFNLSLTKSERKGLKLAAIAHSTRFTWNESSSIVFDLFRNLQAKTQ